jgi:hypothetical protein
MNVSTKEIIFFILVFILILISSGLSCNICDKNKSNIFFKVLIISLLGSLVLFFTFKTAKINENFRLLEITPEKRCDGGLYLSGNNEFCQKNWNTVNGRKDLSIYNCINGHCDQTINYDGNCNQCNGQGLTNGRPLNMAARTPLSNDKWENEMCVSPILGNNPQVL